MPEDTEPLSPEEQQLLEEAMKSYGAPTAEEKHNVHTFLATVSKAKDTTKTGNLDMQELGTTFYSLRSYKLFVNDCVLIEDDVWKDYFANCSEILTATSLSKEGFLMRQATTQTRQIADITPQKVMTENKGWFKKKDRSSTPTGGQ